MADKRADQLKEITERLEQGVKDIFTSEMYTKYLLTMSKFHNYSFNNTLLIAMQRPDATLVAGYNAWKYKFNRYVKKGEKGIQIIAPAPVKEREEREKIDKDTGLTVLNENGEPEIEVVERVIPRFRVTTVFDYAQTDGEPLPTLEVNELTARVKDYTLLKEAIEQVSPVPIRFGEIEGSAKGYYSHMDKEICVRADMGESQTIKTMIHEVAHAMLHDSDQMKQRGEEKDQLTKETEAESIAFTVCSALGIDTSDYSFPYVASWASGKELKELKDSMDDAIISKGEFQQVQQLLELDTRTAPSQTTVYPLSGFLRCADCGQNMIRRTVTKNGKKYQYYHCSTYKNGGGCTPHMINSEKLTESVLAAIRHQVTLLVEAEKVLSNAELASGEQIGIKILDSQITALEAELERYSNLKIRLYQDLCDDVVSREEYGEMNTRFAQKIKEAQDKIQEIREKKQEALKHDTLLPTWLEEFKQYEHIKTLERRVVVELIDHIDVHSKTEIEIHFCFEDELHSITEKFMEYQAHHGNEVAEE